MENLIPTKTIKENGVVAIKNGIKPNPNKLIPIERKPTWLRVKSQNSSKYRELKSIVSDKKLHTVCEEGNVPKHSRMLEPWYGNFHVTRFCLYSCL
jgi:lipoate synthase